MGLATTTTETTMSAIQESLDQLNVMLGRIAARQEKMLVDLKKTTAVLAPTAATMLSLMPVRVPEQQATTPLSPLIISAHRSVAAAVIHNGMVLASSVPTSCSTIGSATNVGGNHAAVAFSTRGMTDLHATTSISARNETLQGVVGSGANTSAGCSAHVLSCPLEDPSTHALEIGTGIPDEVMTLVGGLSLFIQLDWDSTEETFNGNYLKGSVWDEGIPDEVLTHVSGLSLFKELDLDTHMEFGESVAKAGDATNLLTLTICSVQCCHDGGDVQKFAFMSASSSGSSLTPFMLADAEFSPTPSATAVPVVIKCNYTVTPLMIDRMADEVFTDVGGFSLFLELELDSADEVFNDSCLKDIVWDEELADCVITHIGSSSLFLQKIGDAHHEHEGEIQHGHDIGTLFLPWDPGDWCSLQFEIPPWRLSCFSPGKGEHQRDLHCVNIGCSINKEIKQQLCGLVRLWDPCISTAVPNSFHPGIFATQGIREWSYTDHNACQRSNSEKLGHLNILQQRACLWAWQPDRYIQGVAMSDLVSIKTRINFYIFLNEASLSLHKKAENYIMLMGTNLHEHAYEFYSNQRTKLQVQLPWDPNNVHIAQSIICVTPGRPWDPSIVATREWIVLGDNNVEVGATMCVYLTEPLLGGKQCFFEAVMSCPYMEENWTCWTWAVGCWYGLVAWLVSYKRIAQALRQASNRTDETESPLSPDYPPPRTLLLQVWLLPQAVCISLTSRRSLAATGCYSLFYGQMCMGWDGPYFVDGMVQIGVILFSVWFKGF